MSSPQNNINLPNVCISEKFQILGSYIVMIPFQNWVVYLSISFFIIVKLLSDVAFRVMYKRHMNLTSIPENREMEDEIESEKWIPKKKHDVLKAKYKCLKKLFQIYDASVIGILPDPSTEYEDQQESSRKRSRRKRSHRTKTDACAGTTEIFSGDASVQSDDKASIASAVMRDLKINSYSTELLNETQSGSDGNKNSKCNRIDSKTDTSCNCSRGCECHTICNNNFNYNNINKNFNRNLNNNNPLYPLPYLMVNEKRKLTRFQVFVQRLFGLNRARSSNLQMPHIYAASDNNIVHNLHGERRRRSGLRFRRIRRPKKARSDFGIIDVNSPAILTYVQSVQRSCLMDTTPRQCPVLGCQMIFYGIINYNDHLNICHFAERKYVCHYCHEGFEREFDKNIHENEHLGINKLNQRVNYSAVAMKQLHKASVTQTEPESSKCDVSEDKLKKIVSFFDKIAERENIMSEMKKDTFSESNLGKIRRLPLRSGQESHSESESTNTDKRTVSCGDLMVPCKTICRSTPHVQSDTTSCACINYKCPICCKSFDCRQQLNLHMDLEHRAHEKFSKFHNTGNTNRQRHNTQLVLETGKINVQSDLQSSTTLSCVEKKSEESVSYDPSSNVVYYEFKDSAPKKKGYPLISKVRSGLTSYKWEPGTKIIRV